MFLTIYLWSITIISVLITFPICLILYPFVSQKTFSRLYEAIPGYIMLYSMLIPNFWNFTIIDLRTDTSWENKRYVIVANHVSFIDSLLLVPICLKKKFMMARIFGQMPIFGWMARMSGHVLVDKNKPNRLSSIENSGVSQALQTIRDGSSLCLFPEGKRETVPYQLEEFKTGAFHIAKFANIPILPITIKGSAEAMPIGGRVYCSNIELVIGEPFYVEDIQESISKVKQFISYEIEKEGHTRINF